MMMRITVQRIYGHAPANGYKVLVDRLWPRGITKAQAGLDEWCKELAPSTELRKWFHSDTTRWEEFQKKYLHELARNEDEARALLERAGKQPLVLLYGAKDPERNHALVLKQFLQKLG